MRIFNGRDYYDGVQAYGQDTETLFVRQPFDKAVGRPASECGLRPIGFERLNLLPVGHQRLYAHSDKVDNRKGIYRFRPMIVWFTGQRYACVKVSGFEAGATKPMTWCAWNAKELREFLASIESGLKKESEKNVDAWFADKGTDAERDWLISEGVSIAISDGHDYYGGYSWKKYGCWKFDTDGLKGIGFASVVPPWEAFQRLAMWVGGTIARSGRPMVEIENDAVRRDKHGFDKFSFKKQKAA